MTWIAVARKDVRDAIRSYWLWGLAAVLSLLLAIGPLLIVGGFIPSPFATVHEYAPTVREVLIALGVYGIGALVLTVLYKIALGVREELEQ